MKKLIFCVFVFCAVKCFAEVPALPRLRSLYKESVTKESACKQLLGILQPYNEKNNPLLLGYKGCVTMIMAKHLFNPFSKYSYFKKGKSMLQMAIQADQNNVELRFLRFTVQMNAPSFLGYNDHVKTDKVFLQKAVSSLTDAELKNSITTYLQKQQKNKF